LYDGGMSLADDIDLVRRQMPELVHVEDAAAEEAYSQGRILFDVTAGGKALDAFFEARPHLRESVERTPDGRYRHVSSVLPGDRPVYVAQRRDAAG
jgi:hypothetical protein